MTSHSFPSHDVGKVHFNLAENRQDQEMPFAFLATYTEGLSAQGKAQHLPLGQALRNYAGASNKDRLLSLLLPVQRASERCAWLKTMVDAGEIFHPLRWSPQEAFQFLSDVPNLEQSGIVVRMPASWKTGRPRRARITAMVGSAAPSGLGGNALLDFRMNATLDGEALSATELEQLLAATNGLALIRGTWVEVNGEELRRTMARFQEAEQLSREHGLTFSEAMRFLAGASLTADETHDAAAQEWSGVVAGPWLEQLLKKLRSPDTITELEAKSTLQATLRPYQQVGVRWLHLLSQLGLGACLADDMGLGKTIQILALLLNRKNASLTRLRPNLLIAPASLLANWAAELKRFAPQLTCFIAHSSAHNAEEVHLSTADLVITSYGSLLRMPWLCTTAWDIVILDEAQAIKNPDTQQTRAVKKLHAQARIALTGTPIENRLGDLWSIFDFLNPGLLGSAQQFTQHTKSLADKKNDAYGPLRELVRPYLLRRLKTDKTVISDLPDKTEVKAYCHLSRKQAALYQDAVNEMAQRLASSDGTQRRAWILSMLMRLKQICNHPSQWLSDNDWHSDDSGKWQRLRELCEVIAAKQEKVLVFTQFREITAPLATFLESVFERPGLVLHGDTPVNKRQDLVNQFQHDEAVPFFILSLKAGGSGLNLTAASHVIHFDRWWNPAVENQATDRAFRIGQKRNVLVHKFICQGTLEEKIDTLIESKKQLANDLLEGGDEISLTELNDRELLQLVALDLNTAMKE